MAKSMSKVQTIAALAEKTGLARKQVTELLDELAGMAYKEAKNGFVIPGIGKLLLVDRKARLARNPQTGEQIQVPARKAVKFRVAKACKDAVLGG